MKKYIRFDSIGGASGDMILAALTSVGADLKKIEKQLNSFFPVHLRVKSEAAADSGLNGLSVSVHAHHHHHHDDSHWPDAEPEHDHHHRGLNEIRRLIKESRLSEGTKKLSLAIFTKLAEAEAKIHGKTAETVHFHEVGAWDSVADIIGSCLALEQLNISGVSCGALPSGTGTIKCAHGIMPNPAPATQELLTGIPVIQTEEPFELVTPTGAAILATWMNQLAQPPAECAPAANGFGFGSRKLDRRPNVLRATILTELSTSQTMAKRKETTLTILETNLDDCNPEWLAALAEDLLEKGALDVWRTPIIMKKGRAAVMLSVLTTAENSDACRELIFGATTTLGLRSHCVQRSELRRDLIEVETPWGYIPVKRGKLKGRIITLAPEHDRCEKLAKENNVSIKEVHQAAVASASTFQ